MATVYAHFPSLDELLPACGAHVMQRIQPPARKPSSGLFDGAHERHERFARIADELFGFYERGGAHIEVDIRERRLPGMREWESYMLEMVTTRVRAAAAAERPSAQTVQLISAFFDLASFKALRNRGVAPEQPRGQSQEPRQRFSATPRRSRPRPPHATGGKAMTQETNHPTAAQPVAVAENEGEARWWFGCLAILKLTAEQTAGQMSIVEITEPPGAERPCTFITSRTRRSGFSRAM